MDVKLKRMPFGVDVGAVALAVTVEPEEVDLARDELGSMLASRLTAAPGVASIYLESVPWANPRWPEAMWAAQAYPAVMQHGRRWVGVHVLDEPGWVAGDIDWVMDASYLLAHPAPGGDGEPKPLTPSDLAVALRVVPPFPRVQDLIVRPHRSNVDPALLDMIHGFVRAERPAQLLVPAAEVDDALIATIARCESSWIVVTT